MKGIQVANGSDSVESRSDDEAAVSLTEDAVVTKWEAGRLVETSVRRASDGGRISDTVVAGGVVHSDIAGSRVVNEDGALRAAQCLVLHLNQVNAPGAPFGPAKQAEEPADAEATSLDGTSTLSMQVVRANPRELWKALAADSRVQRSDSVSDVATDLRTAIQQKRTKYSRRGIDVAGLSLVIDATDAPQAVSDDVVDEFRRAHGAWVTSVAFAGVWLVGPAPDAVWRLR